MTQATRSIGELIDQLSIKNIECHHCNHQIEDEQVKLNANSEIIADLLLVSIQANGRRVQLRDAINKQLREKIEK